MKEERNNSEWSADESGTDADRGDGFARGDGLARGDGKGRADDADGADQAGSVPNDGDRASGLGGKRHGAGHGSGQRAGHGVGRDVRRHAGRASDADAIERLRVGGAEWFDRDVTHDADDANTAAGAGGAKHDAGDEGEAHGVWRVLLVIGSAHAWTAYGEGSDEMLRWSGMIAYARRRGVRTRSLLEQIDASEETKKAWLDQYPLSRLWAATVLVKSVRRRS